MSDSEGAPIAEDVRGPDPRKAVMKLVEEDEEVWEISYVKGLEQRCEDLEAALQQAYQCCARPWGVCFDPALIDG